MDTEEPTNGQEFEEEEREAEVGTSIVESMTRGEIDKQISTARAYPRAISAFKKLAMEMATVDEETAEACFYVLPRAGRNVEGPSARLAEILASAWGHMRVEGRPIAEDEKFVTARGTAWDMQSNVAISYEVKRRIIDKNGRRFSDDMIGVTANAATSIALRNAILKVVPSPFWKPIYLQCRQIVKGDIETLADRRAAALEHFQKLGVSRDRVFAMLQVKDVEDVTLDNLVILRGLATALKEGDTTIDEAFPAPEAKAEMPKRKSETKPESGEKQEAKKPEQKPDPEPTQAERLEKWITASTDEDFLAVTAPEFAKDCAGLKGPELERVTRLYTERRGPLVKKGK